MVGPLTLCLETKSFACRSHNRACMVHSSLPGHRQAGFMPFVENDSALCSAVGKRPFSGGLRSRSKSHAVWMICSVSGRGFPGFILLVRESPRFEHPLRATPALHALNWDMASPCLNPACAGFRSVRCVPCLPGRAYRSVPDRAGSCSKPR